MSRNFETLQQAESLLKRTALFAAVDATDLVEQPEVQQVSDSALVFEFYDLQEQPFGVTPNPRYFYPGLTHREALASLITGIEYQAGFAALLSAPGLGKTTLLFHLLEQYRSSAHTVFIFHTQCTNRGLLRSIADELQIDTSDKDDVKILADFNLFLSQNAIPKPLIVFIDEAQDLDGSVLEGIRLLSNFETTERKLLHIILAGQPELWNKLRQPRLAQLMQRITIVSRLEPFTADQTREYIQHRLAVAGYRGAELFTPDAVALTASHSEGVPSAINRICFNALLNGCARGQRMIDEGIIAEVIKDFEVPMGTATDRSQVAGQ